jgi:diketogulonate reductase-like aldo/keto reductase
MGQGADLDPPEIVALAQKLGASPDRVILRWHIEKGHVVIPRSTSAERKRANASLDVVKLTAEHIATIDALDISTRAGGDPRTFSLSQAR